MQKEEKALINLFLKRYGETPEVEKITGGGSPRHYYRLKTANHTVVGVWSEDIKENENFLNLDECFYKQGIRVPKILEVSDDKKAYLLQDLGNTSLFSLLETGKKMELSKSALKDLLRIQTLPIETWIEKVGYKPFSERLVKWDLNYFKYDFLKPYGVEFNESALEDDFDLLTNRLLDRDNFEGLMYRDFQSRNIMVKNGEFWYIDFQSARKGPIIYDAVSFIWQAKAPFTFDEREELENFYINDLKKKGYDPGKASQQMDNLKLFRILQVLGAYGFRGLIEKKRHFIESLPFGLKNFFYLKEKGLLDDYPEIKRIAETIKDKTSETGGRERDSLDSGNSSSFLKLTVFSFSYKKGYPDDPSGNGGGFMFDCRAIHNPGRYDEYKSKTGKDPEVKEFLERTEEAKTFIEKAVGIVTPSVDKYIERGFTSLQIGFGCTGGQHRSVYCAEKFAEIMKKKYPEIEVKLIHREQETDTK